MFLLGNALIGQKGSGTFFKVTLTVLYSNTVHRNKIVPSMCIFCKFKYLIQHILFELSSENCCKTLVYFFMTELNSQFFSYPSSLRVHTNCCMNNTENPDTDPDFSNLKVRINALFEIPIFWIF